MITSTLEVSAVLDLIAQKIPEVVGVDAGDCSASQRYSASCVSPLVDVFAVFESCRAHPLFMNP